MLLDATSNSFLVIRTVFFALLTYTHVLILVFASWNIIAAKSSGMPTPGASALLLTSSVFTFVLVPTAYLAELICARARPAQVRVECAWTVLMSLFQLAASINVTISGPPMYCQTHSPWTMCASSFLLVQITWLATLLTVSYCLTICVAASTHAVHFSDVWITPVPHVPWFRLDVEKAAPAMGGSRPHTLKRVKSSSSSWSEASCALTKYLAERWDTLSRTERQSVLSGPVKGCPSVDARQPSWARQRGVRRGVDSPFARPLPKRKAPPVGLPLPPRILPKQGESRFVEICEPSDRTRPCSYWSLTPRTPTVFPQTARHPDLPIPRPGVFEWVRADATRGTTLHEKPIS